MVLSKLWNLLCCRHRLKSGFMDAGGSGSPLRGRAEETFGTLGFHCSVYTHTVREICSWNIQENFWYGSARKRRNILYHISCLDTDVLCLQEAFEPQILRAILHNKTIRDKFPYFLSGDMKNKYIIGENSGLLVLSRYPLHFIDFKELPGAIFPDCMATKGVLYFTVGDLNCAVTHLQSGSPVIAKKQLQFVMAQSPFSGGSGGSGAADANNFIILGDLNLDNAETILGVERNNSEYTHSSERIIDYILPIYGAISIETIVPHFDLDNVSDHYPIIGTILRQVSSVGEE